MTLESNIGLIASNIGPMYALVRWRRWKDVPSHYGTSRLTGHVSAGRGADDTGDDYSGRRLCLNPMSRPQQVGEVSASASVETFNYEDVALRTHEFQVAQPNK